MRSSSLSGRRSPVPLDLRAIPSNGTEASLLLAVVETRCMRRLVTTDAFRRSIVGLMNSSCETTASLGTYIASLATATSSRASAYYARVAVRDAVHALIRRAQLGLTLERCVSLIYNILFYGDAIGLLVLTNQQVNDDLIYCLQNSSDREMRREIEEIEAHYTRSGGVLGRVLGGRLRHAIHELEATANSSVYIESD